MPNGHILRDFDRALDALRADALMMASLTDRNLQNAMTCLLDRDAALCAVTISDEAEVDALEKKIDRDGVEILRRFQPVASDLRQVVSTMKLGANLERVADQAVKIARRSRRLTMEPELDEAIALGPMFIEANSLFRDSIRAFADADTTLARTLQRRDRELDQMNHDIADNLTAKMAERPARIPEYLELLFIARHLERVGDHAKNIGEDAVYTTDAEDIRHQANSLNYA
ncbi:MAG: phosphate signaling complex protein PhoU [Chthoniobacterales bacterium]|nr:phosphate signaling complex protein PhoU [Chthoniobacterales bacterium]